GRPSTFARRRNIKRPSARKIRLKIGKKWAAPSTAVTGTADQWEAGRQKICISRYRFPYKYISARPHRSRGLRRTAGACRTFGTIDDPNRGANKANTQNECRNKADVLGKMDINRAARAPRGSSPSS